MAQASPLLLAAVLVAIAPNLDKLTVGTASAFVARRSRPAEPDHRRRDDGR